MWREWADPRSGRTFGPFASFEHFVTAPATQGGLGSTISQLRGLCNDDVEARDALDKVQKRPPSLHSAVSNIHSRPAGTTERAGLRRLRKDRPDLHARVLAGELKVNAAMVEAGFRHRTVTVPIDDVPALAKALRRHLSSDQRTALAQTLQVVQS